MRSDASRTRQRRAAAPTVAVLAVATAALAFAANPASAASSTAVDLGLLAGGTYASASAINDNGVAAGVATGAEGAMHVVRSGGGTVTDLGACCSAGNSTPQEINNSLEMASFVNAGYASEAVYWNAAGSPATLPTLPGSTIPWARAYDINGAGTIVGHAYDSGNNRHAVVWSRTTLATDLGFLGQADTPYANYASARGINELGQITGEALVGSTYHAFVYRSGSFTDLGPGLGEDLNDAGLVIGHYQIGQPATWTNGVRRMLPSLWGSTPAYGHYVTGVNNNGDIVGYGPPTNGSLKMTALLWRGGRAVNLGFYPGGDVARANGINNLGQVVGECNLVPGGTMHALMWNVGTAATPPGTNTTPTVSLTATTSTSIPAGGSVTFRGSFADPDNGPWTYTFTWGNGTTTGSVAAPGPVTQSRTFPWAGRYRVGFKVTDARGAVGVSGPVIVRVG